MKHWLLSILFMNCVGGLFAQLDTAYIYTYGGEFDEQGRDIELTADSGFIMVGATSSFGNGNSDIYLVKVDSALNYQWSRAIGQHHIEFGHAVKQTADGGYIICGYSNSTGNGTYDGYLVKTDDTGGVVWEKFYGGFDWDKLYDLEITPDGGYLLVGETHSLGNGDADAWVFKTDSLGNVIWEKTFGGKGKDIAHALISTRDGNYAFCGENASKNPENKGDAWLVKFDGDGDTLFDVTRTEPEYDVSYDLVELNNNGFGLIGKTKSKSISVWDTHMMTFDSIGEPAEQQWWGAVGKDGDAGYAISQRSDNKVVFVGKTESSGSGGSDVDLGIGNFPSLLYFDGSTWGRELLDEGRDLILINDSLFLIFGTGRGDDTKYLDFQLILSESRPDTNLFTNYQDQSDPNINLLKNNEINQKSSLVYPNPLSKEYILFFKPSPIHKTPIFLKLIEGSGRVLLEEFLTNEKLINLNLLNIPNGNYILSISSNEKVEWVNLVINH